MPDTSKMPFTPKDSARCIVDASAATIVRLYMEGDFDVLVARWHETNLVSYRYVEEHQRHTLSEAREFFRTRLLTRCRVWVAERSGELCGMLALEIPWIRQFAVFPDAQRQGIGTALLRQARGFAPDELRLFTFQRNDVARAFYAKHGFVEMAFGTSPAPESEPDVELRWAAY